MALLGAFLGIVGLRCFEGADRLAGLLELGGQHLGPDLPHGGGLGLGECLRLDVAEQREDVSERYRVRTLRADLLRGPASRTHYGFGCRPFAEPKP